jgi:flagellum-specific peptidoglycan hydrolase FlgJ
MTPTGFIATYYPYAKRMERETGVPALFALAQGALESGWGKHAPGNMLFGMKTGNNKSFGGWQGDRQLITTTEYADTPGLKFPEVLPGYPKKEGSRWKYLVKDYFRAYKSPLHTFLDWAGMLSKAPRYSKAMQNRNDPFRFAQEIAKAGYATAPNYYDKIKTVMIQIAPLLPGIDGASKAWKVVMYILIVAGVAAMLYGLSRNALKTKAVIKN